MCDSVDRHSTPSSPDLDQPSYKTSFLNMSFQIIFASLFGMPTLKLTLIWKSILNRLPRPPILDILSDFQHKTVSL